MGLVSFTSAQTRTLSDIHREVERYVSERGRELQSAGKRVNAGTREELESEQKRLAAKYAAEASARNDISKTDFYYVARLYGAAGNEPKAIEFMKRFLTEYPSEANTPLVQSGRAIFVVQASRRKMLADAEATFKLWKAALSTATAEQSVLQDHLSLGYYKDGQYDMAVKHSQEAFDMLKSFKARTLKEKRDREQIYMNLIEVLAMSYRKSKNADQSLTVLAQARAESFSIPSAGLYRKVMDFVEGSGFSEKKLMQKVESYPAADAAPEMQFAEWIGHDPIGLEQLRGRVVLLDFWATWCGPCISTFPRLRSWHKKYRGDDFVIIGVTQYYGEQAGKKMSKLQELDYLNEFKAKYKLPYPIAIAGPSEASMKYGINAFPTTVLLDRKGVVRYIGIGAGAEESENLEDTIKKVLIDEQRLAEAR